MSPFYRCLLPLDARPFSSQISLCGGDEEIRTLDPLLAGQVLSQLSYTPVAIPSFFRVLFTDPENRTTKHFTYSAFSSYSFFLFQSFVRWTVSFLFRMSRVIPHCDDSP